MPNTLEEVKLNGIITKNISTILNPILNKSQNLKRLYLSNIEAILDDQIKFIEFDNLGN